MMSESEEINDARENAFASEDQKACFVAGTLVHTAEGLRPISELKVGDLVLSRSEQGGENVLKTVIKTIQHPQKEVVSTKYTIIDSHQNPLAEQFYLTSKTDQPYWIESIGWIAAGRIYYDSGRVAIFSLVDGGLAWYWNTANVYSTDTDLVYVPDQDEIDEGGRLLDVAKNTLLETTPYHWETWAKDGKKAELALCDVHAIEVEDYNTYFVGQHGVWVRA